MPKSKTQNPFRRVARYLFRYRGLFALTLSLAVGSTLFLIAIPQVIKWIVDDVIAPHRSDLLIWGVAALTLCYVLRDAFNSLRIRVNNTLEQKVLVDLRGDLHSRLLKLPVLLPRARRARACASHAKPDFHPMNVHPSPLPPTPDAAGERNFLSVDAAVKRNFLSVLWLSHPGECFGIPSSNTTPFNHRKLT